MRIATRIAAIVLLAGSVVAQGEESPFSPFDVAAFEKHASSLGATQEQIESFRADVADGMAGIGADSLLRSVVSDYDAAVGSAEDGDPRAALALAELLSATRDEYIRAHSRYHLGRVFLDGDDPERAAEIFAAYLREDRNTSALDAEVMYFYAHSLAELPMPERAANAFAAFLRLFPAAPERYVASATQQLAELESQMDSPLHEVADVMKGVERQIRKTRTGKDTQDKQKAVMTKLEKIIEQVEEQEQQSSGAPGGLSRPQAPAGNSQAPPGQTRIGNLTRKSGVVDRWGDLKDREREEIESDLQTKLPGHYRRMLEDYYKRLGSGGQ